MFKGRGIRLCLSMGAYPVISVHIRNCPLSWDVMQQQVCLEKTSPNTAFCKPQLRAQPPN